MEPLFRFVIGDRQAHINWLGPRFLQVHIEYECIHAYIPVLIQTSQRVSSRENPVETG